MRITNDGYISTEVELPREGSRVEYKFSGCKQDAPGVATYIKGSFHFLDKPYNPGGGAGNTRLGDCNGYWRYIDTPGKEKRDSGAPEALAGPSVDQLTHQLHETVLALGAALHELEAERGIVSGLFSGLSSQNSRQREQMRHMEGRIAGQRKALASKEEEITDLKEEIEGLGRLLDDRLEQIQELGNRLAEYEKRDNVSQHGWISADREMPDPWVAEYEVMKDGKNLGRAHAFGNCVGIERGWTLWNPRPTNIDSRGT